MRTTVFWNAVGDDYVRRAAALSLLSLLYHQNLSLYHLEIVVCTQEPQYFVPLLQHDKISFRYVNDSFLIHWNYYAPIALCINPFTIFRKSIIPASERISTNSIIWQTNANRIAFIGFPTQIITETTDCLPETIHKSIADKNIQWQTDTVLCAYSAEDTDSKNLIMNIMPEKIPNLHLDQLIGMIFPKIFQENPDFWAKYAC
ncbi:MAG: hypothetical protein LC115_06900 [Bacteroidia bacterium]|nr:hypothetical protein [Bacteroidia bacterium]